MFIVLKRKSVTAWLKGFIPQKISNAAVLGTLDRAAKIEAAIKKMSFPIPVSAKSSAVIKRHKVQNMNILLNGSLNGSRENNGAAVYAKDEYIENQNAWQEVKFGISDMRYSGCEIIASYNALKALGEPVSEQTVVDLIAMYEQNGAVLGGKFGTSPYAVENYFRGRGYDVMTTTGRETAVINRIGEKCDTVIVNAYNNKNDITAMIHTVSITREEEGTYSVHNAYYVDQAGKNNDHDKNKSDRNRKKDRYVAKGGYDTLQEAIDAISKHDPLSIVVIGISKIHINT